MLNVFVFGSNLAGRHGKGAALTALQVYGAKYGVGEGRTGNSYAIPTKDHHLNILPLQSIHRSVDTFLEYARTHLYIHFTITPIGCGLAGYKPHQIAPFFRDAPPNCTLPPQFLPPPVLSQEPFHASPHPGDSPSHR